MEDFCILQWEDTKIELGMIHHPHWDEWIWMRSKRFPTFLKIYDTGHQEAWLCWLLLGEYGYYPKTHTCVVHAKYITDDMQQQEAWMH